MALDNGVVGQWCNSPASQRAHSHGCETELSQGSPITAPSYKDNAKEARNGEMCQLASGN